MGAPIYPRSLLLTEIFPVTGISTPDKRPKRVLLPEPLGPVIKEC